MTSTAPDPFFVGLIILSLALKVGVYAYAALTERRHGGDDE